jgi:hypothetical protein
MIMRSEGHVARIEGDEKCNFLVGKPERKRLLERPGCRWEDTIKMDLKEIRCEDMNWIRLV